MKKEISSVLGKIGKKSGLFIVLVVLMAIQALALDREAVTPVIVGLSFLAFIVKLGLALWVYLKNPSAKVNKFFAIVFLGQALWDFGKFVMWQIFDPAKALTWGKISYTGYILSVFCFLCFVWAFLKKKNLFNNTPAGKAVFYGVMIAVLVSLWTTNLVLEDVAERDGFSSEGYVLWSYDYGPIYNYFFLWFQILPFVYGLVLFLIKYFQTEEADTKKQLLYVIIGSLFPIVIGIPTGVILPAMGFVLPPHNNILTLILSVFLTIGIAKYKFLDVQPVGEQGKPEKLSEEFKTQFHMDYSKYYFVRHQKSVEISYKVLLNYLAQKHYGLVITTKAPDKIRQEFGIKTTPIIWMTDSETENLSVDPVDIEQLYETIHQFCKKVGNSFIMIDGLDFLVQHNNFSKILHFLQEVKILVENNKGVLIIPEGNLQMDKMQERLIEKELISLPYSKNVLSALQRAEKMLEKKFRSYNHVLLGFNAVTESLLEELEKEGLKPLIVTTKNINHHIPKENFTVIKGDPLSKRMLIKAGVNKPGTLVIITLDEDSEAILAINKVRQLSESTIVVANINNQDFVPIAQKAGATYIVPSSSIGGRLISLTLCAPNAVRWIMDAITLANRTIELVDIDVTKGDRFEGKNLKTSDDLLGIAANIIAVKNNTGLHRIPLDDYIIQPGDHLVLIANLSPLKEKKPEQVRKAISRLTFNKSSKAQKGKKKKRT
ncbi:DUF835 domain-containing protein [Candidatus Woesearchaeota archaeon]|nr:DUF835 domain-containing protein [Candidatus Woesearchaeota archaeon]